MIEADPMFKCLINWSDGTKTHVRLQQKHINNLLKTPIVESITRGKGVE